LPARVGHNLDANTSSVCARGRDASERACPAVTKNDRQRARGRRDSGRTRNLPADDREFVPEHDDLQPLELLRHDLLLTHCGDKGRFPMVVQALRAVRVSVAVVADLDLLRDADLVRRLVELLDGDWHDFETDQRIVSAAVDGLARNPSIDYVRENVAAVLEAATGPNLSREESERIRDIPQRVLRVTLASAALRRQTCARAPLGYGKTRCSARQ